MRKNNNKNNKLSRAYDESENIFFFIKRRAEKIPRCDCFAGGYFKSWRRKTLRVLSPEEHKRCRVAI